jgi:hypothetical protein
MTIRTGGGSASSWNVCVSSSSKATVRRRCERGWPRPSEKTIVSGASSTKSPPRLNAVRFRFTLGEHSSTWRICTRRSPRVGSALVNYSKETLVR